MRQTIELQGNRKAVVQIPYSKLTAQSTLYKQNQQTSDCCESKIIVLGCGKGCGKSSQSSIHMSALTQLQEAYDRDVCELNGKIKKLEQQREQLKLASFTSAEKMRKEFEYKLDEGRETIELLRGQCKKKDNQIADLINQKEIIVRNKISEFRQSQYTQRIRDLQNILKVRDAEIQEYVSKVELLQIQKIKSEEQRAEDQIKWERELTNIKSQFSSLQSQYSKERYESSYASKVKQEDSLRAVADLKSELQDANGKKRQLNSDLQRIKGQNVKIVNENEQLKGKSLQFQQEINALSEKASKLKIENQIYVEKLRKSQQTLYFIDSQKGQLLLQIQSKYAQIEKLKLQLSSRQKVYEVKIERVIDGKAEIQQMQLAIFQLQQQIKQLNRDKDVLAEQLKKKEIIMRQQEQSIFKYTEQIQSLKAYIQKRQGSFKWVVERQIEKDIVVAETKPQIYKVSQISEYTREVKNEQRNVFEKVVNSLSFNSRGNIAEQIVISGLNLNQ